LAAINKRKVLESAQKHLQKGAVDKALKDYQALLDADPRDANVRLKVGDLKLRLGKTDEAIAAYLKVADQFTRDGFDAKAVAIYKQVSKLDGKRFDVYIPLADLYQRLGLTSEAMVALQTAAEAYQRDGRKREALDLLRRMASLDATNTTSRLKVAELLLQEGLSSEALLEFSEVAAELERQGDFEARAGVLERVLELSPESIESYDALITLWLERRQPKRAESLAHKLVGIDVERAESHELLARVLSELGDENGAIDAFRTAADAWIARGMDDRARAILQRYIPSEPFDFGGTTDPLDPRAVGSGSREGESPFGEEGIGAEPLALDDEFTLVSDAAPFAAEAAASVALPPAPVAKPPEPKAPAQPKSVSPASQPVPPAKPIAKAKAPPAVREQPAAPPVAASSAPVAEVPTEVAHAPADLDQLLAEAGVYLRYGKRERAIASLEILLRSEPQHAAALELLGDAHAGAEETSLAVDAWTRAAQAAAAMGDATRVATLRSRIEAIDASAAAALPDPVVPPRSAATATMLFEAPAPAEAETDAGIEADADDSESLEDIEIDIEAAEFGDPTEEPSATETEIETTDIDVAAIAPPESAAASTESTDLEIDADAFADMPGEGDGDSVADGSAEFAPTHFEAAETPGETSPLEEPEVPDSFEVADGASEAVAEPFVEPAPVALQQQTEPEAEPVPELELPEELELEPAHPPQPEELHALAPSGASASSESSSTTSAAITEELEEAAFYFEQGLLDEAEAIYLRVVQRAPHHPSALLRLGEIAVARGHDAARPVAEVAQAAEEGPLASESATFAVQEVEPPDDLDLTAREFGPTKTWQDDESDDVAAPAPDVVPADDVTEGGFAIETESAEPVAAAAPMMESEPETPHLPDVTLTNLTASQPEAPSEPELTVPEVSIAEDAGAPAFDLAAELSEALTDGAPATRAGASTDADGFSSLFSEFKRGVSRTLGEGDIETHFDLGIAYREMGLLDDAIGEFHYALGSTARRLDALHMMGLCALDVGRASDAIGHLEQALASPDVPAERETALRFDLGRAHEAEGDRDRALEAFRRVAELDDEFQDVGARIEALLCVPVATDDDAADEEKNGEVYESFDDLIAEAADEAPAVAEPELVVCESYENFDEFSSDGTEDDTGDGADEAGEDHDTEAEAGPEPAESVAAATEVTAEAEDPQAPDAEPEPPAGASRRRKVSFF
jgi:tetratricopeptide (TPR) repeat protein